MRLFSATESYYSVRNILSLMYVIIVGGVEARYLVIIVGGVEAIYLVIIVGGVEASYLVTIVGGVTAIATLSSMQKVTGSNSCHTETQIFLGMCGNAIFTFFPRKIANVSVV